MNPNEELKEMKQTGDLAKKQVEKHLSIFDDIDLLFERAKEVLKTYFLEQHEYTDFEKFKIFIKGEIKFYVDSFSLKRKDKKPHMKRLESITENYDKLIYFGEVNPVEELNKNVKDQVDDTSGNIDIIV